MIEFYSVDSVIHLSKNYRAYESETLDNEVPDGGKGEKRGGPLGGVGPSKAAVFPAYCTVMVFWVISKMTKYLSAGSP